MKRHEITPRDVYICFYVSLALHLSPTISNPIPLTLIYCFFPWHSFHLFFFPLLALLVFSFLAYMARTRKNTRTEECEKGRCRLYTLVYRFDFFLQMVSLEKGAGGRTCRIGLSLPNHIGAEVCRSSLMTSSVIYPLPLPLYPPPPPSPTQARA